MKAPNPSEPRTGTWPENILLCLVLLAPIALCIALFLPNRDNTEMPVLLAAIFLFASMISLFPVLHLQKDQQKIARATVPFVAACPLGILAVSNGGAMAWMFVLLESLCLGLLLCTAAEAILDVIHRRRAQAAAAKAAPARKASPAAPHAERKPAQAPVAKTAPARPASSPVRTAIHEWESPRPPRPSLSDITFPVKDVIGEPFARGQYYDLWKYLYLYPRGNDSTSHLEINRLTGEVRRVTREYRGQESATFIDRCTELDIRRCGDEKLKDFTAANWRAYVPETPPRPIPQRTALVVSAEECRPGITTDVDAYYMVRTRQTGRSEFEFCCIYLRRCDTGWRLFCKYDPFDSCYTVRPNVADEQQLRQLTEDEYTFDRLLTADETAWVMNLLPARHDGVQGIRSDWLAGGTLEACYWKDGFRVDCAQLPHLPSLFEKLAALAERGLVVE